MTWSPLACGIVSGKYDSGIPPYSRASLKVKKRPGWGRGQAGRAFWRGGAFGLTRWCWAGLPWATVCGKVRSMGTWSPSWPDPMSRKAAHLWDIPQVKKPLTPPPSCPPPRFSPHNLLWIRMCPLGCLLPL